MGNDVLGKINLNDGWNSKENVTVLMLAAYGSELDVFNMVLDKIPKERINDRDSKSWTAIHYASASKIASKEKIELLVKRHSDISMKAKWDNDNQNQFRGDITPLMIASIVGNREAVKYLLKTGSKIQEKDRHGLTAMDYSFFSPRSSVLEDLLTYFIENSHVDSDENYRRMLNVSLRLFESRIMQFDRKIFMWLQGHFFIEQFAKYKMFNHDQCSHIHMGEFLNLSQELTDQVVRKIPNSNKLSFYEIGNCVYNDCDISLNLLDVVDSRCIYCAQQIL